MCRDHRLHEHRRVIRINARRDIERGHVFDLFLEFPRILVNRNRVLIDNAVNRFVIVLDARPGLERPQVVADVQVSGRLHPGEKAGLGGVGHANL